MAARGLDIVLVSYGSFDTPRVLAGFRKRQKLAAATWHLLTGAPQDVRRLARRIGLGGYLDLGDDSHHSFRILLLDESGVVRKEVDLDHPKESSLFDGDDAGGQPVKERR